ncbi:MAG: sn-glycerol-3-phosphate ABC transporter ATP-binding protein UgpC [Candidatus Neomarinimicrobiota bacterium]
MTNTDSRAAFVSLRHIEKYYDRNPVLHDINLDIAEGEFVVLVGPSGCGKSTTLRIIAGLEEISSGDLFINGRLMNAVAPKDRDIAMVFQNYALYPHMSVYKNMAFGLKLRKFPNTEIDSRVRETAAILGLENYLDRRPKELSGGERQRVALGRAIVRKPNVFLFDEPLSNLDAKLRVQMRTEIKKLHKQLKTTMVYVTHDQVEAMTMGDRVVVMENGYIRQTGSPLDIYRKPLNRFVAGFIGSPPMNLIRLRIAASPQPCLIGDDIRLELPDSLAGLVKDRIGESVTAGIRPEDLKLTSGTGDLLARVSVTELLGSESNLHVSVGETALVARVAAEFKFEIGAAVQLTVDTAKLHLFAESDGNRIN